MNNLGTRLDTSLRHEFKTILRGALNYKKKIQIYSIGLGWFLYIIRMILLSFIPPLPYWD